MKIAVASGKGGTGKTTVATSLALALQARGAVAFLDCDVEEPNAHLYLKPRIETREAVHVAVPAIDEAKCTGCGLCAEVCAFNAIAAIKDAVMVFPELCHGCSACWTLCPEQAIGQAPREVGVVARGWAGPMAFGHGWLRVGEAMSPPLIRAVKADERAADIVVLDAPPGTSCPVVETVREADVAALVTEPTPFGLNDLELAAEMAEELGVPAGVVVNRAGIGDGQVAAFCQARGLPILMEVPFERRIAEATSRGEPLVAAFPEYRPRFEALAQELVRMASR
ncbi:MAG: ATP-binding protein [Candidatus Brocadiia bacterium]